MREGGEDAYCTIRKGGSAANGMIWRWYVQRFGYANSDATLEDSGRGDASMSRYLQYRPCGLPSGSHP